MFHQGVPGLANRLNAAARAALASGDDIGHRALGQPAPAQVHTRPSQINLTEHRIRRQQALGGLTSEYQIAA